MLLVSCLTAAVSAESALDESRIGKENNIFAFELYSRLRQEPGNLCVSPFSIRRNLTMVSVGARGETARQMGKALRLAVGTADAHVSFAAMTKEIAASNRLGCEVVMASSLWAQLGHVFCEPFQDVLREQYDTEVNKIDLTGWPNAFDPAKAALARKQINDWVASKTQGKIREALPSKYPDPETVLVLVDTLWFKGRWESPFPKARTANAPFQLGADKVVEVPMMHVSARCGYAETDALQILEIPYASNQLSMAILLPKAKDGLAGVEQRLTGPLVDHLLTKCETAEYRVCLPKCDIKNNFRLSRALTHMGMRDAFSMDLADFSGITPEKPFFLKEVIHQTDLHVDEEGSEAAAVTMSLHLHSAPPEFNADHPFLFLIRHNRTGAILFMGRVANPLAQ